MKLSFGKVSLILLVFFSSDYFVNSEIIDDDSLAKNNYKINDIKTVLPTLKGGAKYVLAGINFYGGVPILLPISYSSVNSLCKLMKKNKKMIIRVEGHSEAAGAPSLEILKELSEQRARTVYKVLLANGIEKKRVSTIGFGSKYMLFPSRNATEEERSANRRVEINVISIE